MQIIRLTGPENIFTCGPAVHSLKKSCQCGKVTRISSIKRASGSLSFSLLEGVHREVISECRMTLSKWLSPLCRARPRASLVSLYYIILLMKRLLSTFYLLLLEMFLFLSLSLAESPLEISLHKLAKFLK